MNGNDRIYSSMGPHVFDMYTHASEYKGSPGTNVANENGAAPSNLRPVLMKYFGTDDTMSIYVQAAEQEFGAWKKKKKDNKSK